MNLVEKIKTNTLITQCDLAPLMKRITLSRIMEVIADVTGINETLLPMRTRKREIADARHLFFFFARAKTIKSLSQIGDEVDRDHSSVLHGAKKINDLIKSNNEIRDYVNSINSML